MALTLGLTRSMRARCAAITSRAETSLRRMRAARSTALRSQRSSGLPTGAAAGLEVCAEAGLEPSDCSAPPRAADPITWPKARREMSQGLEPGPISLDVFA